VTVKVEPTDNFKTVYRFDYTVNDYTGEGFGSIYQQPIVRGLLVGQNPALMTQISRERPKAVNNNSVPAHTKAWGHSLTSDFQATDSLAFKNIFANRKSYYLSPWSDFGGLGGLVNLGTAGFSGLLTAPVAAATIGAPFFLQGASTYANDTQWSDEFQINYDSRLVTLTTGASITARLNGGGRPGSTPASGARAARRAGSIPDSWFPTLASRNLPGAEASR